MQLIEIIQLALVLFIVLSIIIFSFSYVGYRRKFKTLDFPIADVNDKKVEIIPPKVVENSQSRPEPVKEKESIKKNQRFEVFVPDVEIELKSGSKKNRNKNSHHPKTLNIKHKQ